MEGVGIVLRGVGEYGGGIVWGLVVEGWFFLWVWREREVGGDV